MMALALICILGPVVVMSVDPKACYMWDKCRSSYEKQGAQVIFWECGSVPAGCFFRGKK